MQESWNHLLAQRLPQLGHRNWIGVVDMAYPLQTAPGVEMVWTGAGFFDVLETVRQAVAEAPHVRAVYHYDAELERVRESRAPGAEEFKRRLGPLLGKEEALALPHEELIAKLDAAGQLFGVLLLKTTLAIPYTSVLLQLECGYWTAEAEQELRATP
jgi:hypothetical protein